MQNHYTIQIQTLEQSKISLLKYFVNCNCYCSVDHGHILITDYSKKKAIGDFEKTNEDDCCNSSCNVWGRNNQVDVERKFKYEDVVMKIEIIFLR